MAFQLFCMTLIGLLFGLILVFGGYRLFIVLLPIWGFFFGFGLGAQTVQVLFGVGFLASISSWVIGFFVGALFAVLSYLFYLAGVAILAGSAGYGIAVGILTWLGLPWGLIVWIIAIVAAVALAFVVLRFNIQKYAVIVITALAGTSTIIFTLLATIGNVSVLDLLVLPVAKAISSSFWWFLVFIVLAAGGIFVQYQDTRSLEVEEYNRWSAEGAAD
jgi:hypothetical protein